MKGALRLFLLMGLTLLQAMPLASARADTTAAANAPADPQLYRAFLEASAKDSTDLQAPGLQVNLIPRGLSVAPASSADWQWHIEVDGFGREGSVAALSSPKASAADGRSILAFGTDLQEWFRTTGVGLEQGFNINAAPRGNGRLVLHMGLTTTLDGTLSQDNRSLSFDAGGGQVLHYADLRVFDTNDKDLDASLLYTPKEIIIQVDDRGAAYPLTVDPVLYLETEQQASDGAAYDNFGGNVSISDDTAVVGSPWHNSHQGAAYVFVRSDLLWNEQAELTAYGGAGGDEFGTAVAISGDTIIVGAPSYNSQMGKAYVFAKPSGGWTSTTEDKQLTATDIGTGGRFGRTVAIQGDTAVIGAYGQGGGAAYVFVRPGPAWASMTETAKLTASDAVAGDGLGYAVAISGNTVVAGAPFRNTYTGVAYVFVKPGTGWTTATQNAKLTVSGGGAAFDYFGVSVAISGDTIVVGADGALSTHGAAYVFVKPVSAWGNMPQTSVLIASDGGTNDSFGHAVGISGSTVVVGADGNNGAMGKAYVYIKPSAGWSWPATATETSVLTASDGAPNSRFGYSVAMSGNTVVVGAPFKDYQRGAAYFYYPQYDSSDLAVSASASSLTPHVGDTISLTVGLTNNGWQTADSTAVEAPLPAGLSYVSSTANYAGVYDPDSGMWSAGTLALGVTAILKIKAVVQPAAAGTQPVFTASLAARDTYPVDNNTASITLMVSPVNLSPASVSFPSQLIGSTSPAQMITMTGEDPDGASLGTLSITSPFILSADSCSTADLSYLDWCTLAVTFKPNATGPYLGHVSIPILNPASTLSLPLSGTGVAGTQLLTNRWFELDGDSDLVPDGWTAVGTWISGDGRTCSAFHSGACSFTLIGSGTTKQLTQTVVKSGGAGDDFRAAVYPQGNLVSSSTAAAMRVKILNGVTTISTQTFYMPAGTYGWTKKVLNFTAPSSYTSLQVILWYTGASGQVWFDDASLTWAP